MKDSNVFLVGLLVMITSLCWEQTAYAETSEVSRNNQINFIGSYPQEIYDPENPEEVIDPGPSPQTHGDLRIDFVPTLNFGSQEISDQRMTAYSNAQLIHGEGTGPRGNFLQVTDVRGTGSGWTLQVKQERQFYNEGTQNQELNGAILSFDQSWANARNHQHNEPTISKDIIMMDHIGESYNLAQAEVGKGQGSWSISFGGSVNNPVKGTNSLSPRLDNNNQLIKDQIFSEQIIHQNQAISLSVPGATKIDPVPYQTVLTWTLSELP